MGPDLTPRVAEELEKTSTLPGRPQPVLSAAEPAILLSWDSVRGRVKELSAPETEMLLRQLEVDVPSGKENRVNAAIDGLQALVKKARQDDRMEKAKAAKAAEKEAGRARAEEAAATRIQARARGKRDRQLVAIRRKEAAIAAEKRRFAAEKAENWRRAQEPVEHAVVWLHGHGETEVGWQEAFSGFSLPEDAGGCRWIWPRAALSHCSARGGAMTAQWFDMPELPVCRVIRGVPDKARQGEDPSQVEVAVERVHAALDALVAEGIPAYRIAVGGFEQGAALAVHAVLRYGKTLAGAALIGAWLPCIEELEAKGTPAGRATSFLWCHGARDATVEPALAIAQSKRLQEELGVTARFRLFPEFGYGVDMEVVAAVGSWMVAQLLAPAPREEEEGDTASEDASPAG